MTNQAEMTVDFSDFNKKFNLANRKTLKLANEGMRQAGLQLKLDADDKEPKTPLATGTLKASGRVDEQSTPFYIRMIISYNTAYASAVHENLEPDINWTEPGSGPKFLESKIFDFGPSYIKLVADFIKKGS